ncbi:MAG TPA: CoA pyrophosphatase [Polyangiaceae bacterium]|nr:CoA pyrophosphatase [Polyangiaceae bacterium]
MSSFASIVERLLSRNAPPSRPEDEQGLRAAVAAVLRPKGDDAEILFIRRAEREGDPWSGHMAFPGGRRQQDESLLTTATRETLEEVGLDLTGAEPITRLPDLAPYTQMPSPLIVTPFVFALPEVPALRPNEEVAEALWAPLDPVLRREPAITFHYSKGDFNLDLPAIDLEGRIVWGLTYRMIEMLADAVLGNRRE